MKRDKKSGNVLIQGPNAKWMARKASVSSPTKRSDSVKRDSSLGVFIGPSVEGVDEEYVKVHSGKVVHKKPSFA